LKEDVGLFNKLSAEQRKNRPNDEELQKEAEMIGKLKMEVSQEMGLKPKANNKKK
jgi:hypothetical protein